MAAQPSMFACKAGGTEKSNRSMYAVTTAIAPAIASHRSWVRRWINQGLNARPKRTRNCNNSVNLWYMRPQFRFFISPCLTLAGL